MFDTARKEHIRVVGHQDGVLLRGRWLTRDDLQNRLILAVKQSQESAGGG